MTRNELKEALIKLHEEKGISYTWFAKQLQIHRNNISYFIRDQRDISDRLASKLEQLIISIL